MALIIISATCMPARAANMNVPHPRLVATSPVAPGENFKAAHQRPRIFQSLIIKTNTPQASSPFVSVLKTVEAEKTLYKNCDVSLKTCPAHLRRWRARMHELRKLKGYTQLARLNAELNALARYKTDAHAFGRNDYWASPAQMLSAGGDCEDFAILKYVSMRELGYSQDALRLVIVQDTKRKAGHAILTVVLNGKIYALDSLMDAPAQANEITHYRPVYSLSATQRWLHVGYKKRVPKQVAHSKPD